MTPSELDRWLFLSGTSERRFASMAGVKRSTLYGWRTGLYSPRPAVIDRLNEAILQRNSELLEAIDLGYMETNQNEALCCA